MTWPWITDGAQSADFQSTLASALRFSHPPVVGDAPEIQYRVDTSGTYGPVAVIFGNTATLGFQGTGSPLGIYAPLSVGHTYGEGGIDVAKTVQGFFGTLQFKARTVDDSAQGFNFGVYFKNTGVQIVQAKPIVAGEFGVQLEGTNHSTSYVLGAGARLRPVDTAVMDIVYGFKSSLWTKQNQGAGYGTAGEWKAFYDDLYNPAASSFGLNASLHGRNMVGSEQGYYLSRTGLTAAAILAVHGSGGSNPAFLQLTLPNPATATVIADGAFTNLSREMTTATAPTSAWIGRKIANANVPSTTSVLSYYGSGPYTIVMDTAATAAASGQAVTFSERDMRGIKVVGGNGGTHTSAEAHWEGWQFGATNAVSKITRLGQFMSAVGFVVRDGTLATDLAGIDATGYHTYSATLEQTTVGAAGAASAMPTPVGYFKIKDSGGNARVVAYFNP